MIADGGVADDIAAALNVRHGGMTTCFTGTFSYIGPDGSNLVESIVSRDARTWEIMGLLEHARQDCRLIHRDEYDEDH